MPSKSGRLSARSRVVYCAFRPFPTPQANENMTRAAAFLILLLAGSSAVAADWPQWRGPNRDGVSTERGLLKEWPKDGPKLAWKANLGGAGYGSPVIVGDKLFISAAEDDKNGLKEFAVCLNTKDGSKAWKVALPAALQADEGGYSTGWGSGPRSSPTVDGDVVYVLGGRGDLVCLKVADGSQVWTVNLKKDFEGGIPDWGYSESVLIDGDNLICTPGGKSGTVLALEKKTGKKVWQSADVTDPAGYASRVVADVGGVGQGGTQPQRAAISVRAKDGKLLWRSDTLKRFIAVIPTPIVHNDLVFFTTGYGAGSELYKLTSQDGTTTAKALYSNNR